MLYRAAAAGRTDVLGVPRHAGPAARRRQQRRPRLAEEERSPVHDVVSSGGGQPLDEPVRADMEGRLGHDFGDVRVHTGEPRHTFGALGERPRLHGRLQHRVPARTSTTPARDRADDARPRADPRRPAAQRTGGRDRHGRRRARSATPPTASNGRRRRRPSGSCPAPAAPATAQRVAAGAAVVQRDADEATAQGTFPCGRHTPAR